MAVKVALLLAGVSDETILTALNAILNSLQLIALTYIAAKYTSGSRARRDKEKYDRGR